MAIEGLHNVPGIPPVKREERPSLEKRKKERKKGTKKQKKETDTEEGHEKGRMVDIRI